MNESITLELALEELPGFSVVAVLEWGDGLQSTADFGAEGVVAIPHAYSSPGNFTIAATVVHLGYAGRDIQGSCPRSFGDATTAIVLVHEETHGAHSWLLCA